MTVRRGETMLGPGGKLRRPRSEGSVLERNIELLEVVLREEHDSDLSGKRSIAIRNIIRDLTQLHAQVSAGYHHNPYTPFRVIGVIGEDVHSVAYKHAKDGKLYKHDFRSGSAQVIAVERHGKKDLLITGIDGVPLWDEF